MSDGRLLHLDVDLENSPTGFFKSHVRDDRGRELVVGNATIVFQRQGPLLVLELPLFDHNVTIRNGTDA